MNVLHSPGYDSAPNSQRRAAVAIGLIVVVAILSLGLRLYRIDAESLWMDEVRQVSYYGLPLKYVVIQAAGQAQPPLDYLLGAALHRAGLVGSDWWVRFPAAFFGAAGVLLFGLLVRRIGQNGAGVLAAILLAVCPLHVAMSQEARPYTIFFFFALATILTYAYARDRRTLWRWSLFAATLLCMLMTRWVGPHVVAMCLAGYAMWRRSLAAQSMAPSQRQAESTRFTATLISMLAAYAAYNPLFGLIVAMDSGFAARHAGQVWGARVAAMLRDTFDAVVGADVFASPVVRLIYISATFAVMVLGTLLLLQACRRSEGRRLAVFVFVLLVFPVVYAALYAGFTWFPAKPQYLLIGSATFCAAAALAIRAVACALMRNRSVSFVAAAVLFIAVAMPMVAATWRDIHAIEKQDWRGALAYLRVHADPEDAFASLRPGGVRKGVGSDLIGVDRYLQRDWPWLHVGLDTKTATLEQTLGTQTDNTLWVLCNAAPHGVNLLTPPPHLPPGVRVHRFHGVFLLELLPGTPADKRFINTIALVDQASPSGGGLVAPNLLRAKYHAKRGNWSSMAAAVSAAQRQCRSDEDVAAVATFSSMIERLADAGDSAE